MYILRHEYILVVKIEDKNEKQRLSCS